LLTKGRQLLLQVRLGLLRRLSKIGFLLQLLSQGRHLLVKSTKGPLVLLLLIGQGLITLLKLVDHPFLSDTPILKLSQMHQRLKTRQLSANE